MLRRMLCVVGLACVAAGVAGAQAAPARGRALYGRLPLTFEQNTGRYDKRVRFLARTGGGTLFLSDREAVLSLPVTGSQAPAQARRRPGPPMPEPPAPARRSVLRMKLAGSVGAASAKGLQRQKGIVNYFIGNDPKKWRTNISTFARVKMAGVYPGIDLVYYGSPDRALEYDFVVKPGSDPGRIRLAFSGARKLALAANGDLIATTEAGEVRLKRPYAYQQIGGKRVQVACSYTLKSHEARMQVARYDGARPLVVDPVLDYGTYLGGSNVDWSGGIAVDDGGCMYVAGSTESDDFPTTSGAFQVADSDSQAVFLSKLNISGTDLIYSTYLGGSGRDIAMGIAVDQVGCAYITGHTSAPDFPVLGGVITVIPGEVSVFVASLTASGSTLRYGTYLGGSNVDWSGGIAVDDAGCAYVTGTTESEDFPATEGAYSIFAGPWDVFITKFNAYASKLEYSTIVGGWHADDARGIAVDDRGCAYVIGTTDSSDFPTTSQAFQPIIGTASGSDGTDGFVLKLSNSGKQLLYSTFLGGSDSDTCTAIAVGTQYEAYVCGVSISSNFPITLGAMQSARPQTGCSTFVAKLNSSGSGVVYATFLSGDGGSQASAIAVDCFGCAHVAGSTGSVDFPTTSTAFQTAMCGTSDAYASKLNPSGTGMLYSTYLGGSSTESAYGIAVDSLGRVCLAGTTVSADFPTSDRALSATLHGESDAFVARLVWQDVIGTAINVTPALGCPGASVALSARLTTYQTGQPVAGRTLAFSVAGQSAGSAITSATGVAALTFPVLDGLGVGSHPMLVSCAADASHAAVAGTATLTVSPAPTFAYVVDRRGVISERVQLKSWLKRLSDNAWLPGRTMVFSIDGTAVGSSNTDSTGMAFLDWVVGEGPLQRPISAAYAGEAAYQAAKGTASLTLAPAIATTLTLPDRAAELADDVLLKAYLYRDDQAPIEGKAVTFHVDGTQVGSATSNYQGRAMLEFTVPGTTAAGRHDLEARWAGNGGYLASSGSAALWISRAPSYLWLASRTIKQGGAAYLRSYLRRLPDYVWLPGKPVSYKLDGVALGSATTDASGCASLLYNAPAGMALGGHTMVATFGGDATYLANGSSGVLTVTP